MKYKGIQKVHQGDFVTRYDITYETEGGRSKRYEMISRDPHIGSLEDLQKNRTDAVVLIIHDVTGEKLLLNREFRMAVGEWVYNFPAGLIDGSETYSEAAARELREETGLKLEKVTDIWKESFSAVGFSNEKSVVLVGVASGDILPSDSDLEEIEANWFTKEEVKKLLLSESFAARTQTYCALWCRG